jgi:hypothetical protein
MRYFVVLTGLIMMGTGALMITLLPSVTSGSVQLPGGDEARTAFQSFDSALLQVRDAPSHAASLPERRAASRPGFLWGGGGGA